MKTKEYIINNAKNIAKKILQNDHKYAMMVRYATDDGKYTFNVRKNDTDGAIILSLTRGSVLEFSVDKILPAISVLDSKDIYSAIYYMLAWALETEDVVQQKKTTWVDDEHEDAWGDCGDNNDDDIW